MRDDSVVGPLHYGEVIWLGRSVADALESIHRAGRVHGQVTPTNIVWDEDGNPKLLDPSRGGLTQFDDLFIAPEVRNGAPESAASDVYSLAATLQVALGARPRRPADLSDDTAERLTAVLAVAMAPNPTARYPSAAAMRDALDGVLGGRRWITPRLLVSSAVVLLVVLVAVTIGSSLGGRAKGRVEVAAIDRSELDTPPPTQPVTTTATPAPSTTPETTPTTAAAPITTPSTAARVAASPPTKASTKTTARTSPAPIASSSTLFPDFGPDPGPSVTPPGPSPTVVSQPPAQPATQPTDPPSTTTTTSAVPEKPPTTIVDGPPTTTVNEPPPTTTTTTTPLRRRRGPGSGLINTLLP